MEKKNWTICSFLFYYKKVEYIVLVKRFVGEETKVSKYALVKLHFMRSGDLQNDLEVEANRKGLLVDAKTLRVYFGIDYQENLGDIIRQFAEALDSAIPTSVPDNLSDEEKSAMVRSLSKSDSEDPSKVYCTKVRRNPNGGRRSEFNSDKTKLLRPNLFEYLSNDPGISFCYSAQASQENDDDTILKHFTESNAM
ncbi:hypothetical protein BBOMB_0186 [Bifidobacterium bombi DSM 19703]|uniref:Uncharacterized protein n=2 Tax=Bifidobacterium bombi TaxID=471511 RepID=A0A080N5P7_9BIFI|nr:DUF6037 family protein [Bifidobacterium bombi]KFF30869.1 hypothetical protein BBOMB_0186 [Bifidobacterium bombi DSM 19703]